MIKPVLAIGAGILMIATNIGGAFGWLLAPIQIPFAFAVLLLFIPADEFQSMISTAARLIRVKLLNRLEKAETAHTDDETKAKPP